MKAGFPKNKKAVALLLVLVTIVVVVILASVALRLILNQFRLTHHQVSRIRAYYASFAGMNLALEKIRLGDWSPASTGGAIRYGCINSCIDASATYPLIRDSDIPYNVQIAIYPAGSGISGTSKLEIKSDYTYHR
ncbi:MAG: hypothetical protein ISS32_01750 [Candidatus Omnitrophica bacterium]|nr:hypothetical protein [Candidatus Omnitrophota bacterium]MBL7210492.1 hypothetical protein [Candidatus Omnitrophota bacterium]